MNIRFADASDTDTLGRFNDRLKAGGSKHHLILDPRLPGEERYRPDGFPVFRRWMIAEEGREIRAAIQLYHNNAYFRGREYQFCWSDMPISEGIVNREYSLAILQLMKGALSYQPFLMTLGVGNLDVEAYQFLAKLGWKHEPIPFFFYPVKATRVLLDLAYLKRRPVLRSGALIGAYSGSGIILSGLLAIYRRLRAALSAYDVSVEPAFGDWADRVFQNSIHDYAACIRSDATTLNIVYSPDNAGYARVRVRRKKDKGDAGWILVAQRQMRDHRYFGDVKVGTLADGFGRPEDVPALISAGISYLAKAGVDLVVANFSHRAWVRACRRSGMFQGPSSYHLFVSPGNPPLQDDCRLPDVHVGRGHSDGLSDLVDDFVLRS